MSHKNLLSLLLSAIILVLCCQCRRAPDVPKPNAYLRIDLPMATYRQCDSADFPFRFKINNNANIVVKKHTSRDFWADIIYPQFDGVVFLSYKRLSGLDDLRGQVDTSSRLIENHYPFASGIDESYFIDTSHHVYATTYRLRGKNVASTYQFWATDSLNHFLRGSLYINRTPNNDSLSPILDYLQFDVDYLIGTLRWNEN